MDIGTAEHIQTSTTIEAESDEEHHEHDVADQQGNGQATSTMKRSCNNCRQQKLRCDVIQTPFTACSRCRRLKKECYVDMTFKRVGKRDKYAKMQREIDDLKKQLNLATEEKGIDKIDLSNPPGDASLQTMNLTASRKLGDFEIAGDVLNDLYKEYFTFYHPFLPFLDPQSSLDHYFQSSPLLGWSIAMIGARRFKRDRAIFPSLFPHFVKLLWSTIAEMPLSYHVAKALCLICFWQLLAIGDFKDPTFQLTGIMIQIGIQNMLHLPTRTHLLVRSQQTPYTGEVTDSYKRDRLMTWAACNIVGQSLSLIYGLFPQTTYDWVLGTTFADFPYQNAKDLTHQLRIARFCNHFIKALYCSPNEPTGLLPENARLKVFHEMCEMRGALALELKGEMSAINQIYLLASQVHLHAFAFFIPLTSVARDECFIKLYNTIRTFLHHIMAHETSTSSLLSYCDSLISQTILHCISALLRLLNSPFSTRIDIEDGKALLNSSLLTARAMTVQEDDIAARAATRFPKMWKEWGAGAPWDGNTPDPLVLTIPFRMSASHVYDGIWKWREFVKTGSMFGSEAQESEEIGAATGPPKPVAIPGYDINALPSYGLLDGFNMDNIDFFNSMDWEMEKWAIDPTASIDLDGTI